MAIGRAPVTLMVTVACLLLAAAGEPVGGLLAWDRAAMLHGEAWRLLTGHLVHFSLSHALADALVLLAMGMLVEPAIGSRRYALVLAAGALSMSLGLLVCAPALAEYRGASGLAVLAAVLAGASLWRQKPNTRLLVICAGVALAAKIVLEILGGSAAVADLPAGVTVAWEAHVLGALLGAFAAGALPAARKISRTDSGSRPVPRN